MQQVMRSWINGISQVSRAPLLVALVAAITMASAVPFAVVLQSQLQQALAHQPPVDLGSGEIDADWWSEFRPHASGLAATFTPAVIGFAAPLDNLSAVLDGTRRPLVLAIPIAAGLVLWAWLWGIALHRFHLGRGLSITEAIGAGLANFPRLLAIGATATAVQILLYVTVHRALFGPVFAAFVAEETPEPTVFAVRVVLYLVFALFIVPVSLIADYARVAQIVERPDGASAAIVIAAGFVRRHVGSVAGLYLLTGMLFVVMIAGYGVIDTLGGWRVDGWRGIAIGQAFVLGRLVLRLVFGGSELALFKSLR